MDVLGIEGPVVLSGNDSLSVLEDECLPLFAAGFLDAHSDGERRLGYAVTDKGRKAIAAGKPAKPPGLPQYDPGVRQEYIDHYHAALDSRERWKPANSNCVVIALGCGARN